MAGSVNKVILVGNLGADPEVRTFGNGGKVAKLRMATSESWKDRNTGERREKTEWHTVEIMGEGLVGVVERYVKKGSKLYIEGQLVTDKWQDQSGNDRYSTKVKVAGPNSNLTMLDGRSGGGGGGGYDQGGGGGNFNQDRGGYGGGGRMDASKQSGPAQDFDLDDEIPF